MARQGVSASHVGVVLLAAPELAAATPGVIVRGGGTEALLALVVVGESDLERDGDQEEEAKVWR